MSIRPATLAAGLSIILSAQSWAGTDPALTTVRVASGLTMPTFVTYAPGDFEHIFILEKTGRIRVMDLATETLTVFVDINSIVVNPGDAFDERGLLGMAFHPDWANNGYFYLYYVNNVNDDVLSRFSVIPDTDPPLASATATVLLTIDDPESNHNGGWLGFGPNDGYLYISTGDGGGANDQHGTTGNGQDITNMLLGKMLRIDVDGNNGPGGTYGIPADNPFVGETGDDQIWAYGLRNPWRCSFDRLTGDLWIGDVGQGSIEEIDFQPASSTGGENYGWRCMEGNSCTGLSGCTCNAPSLTDPIHTYPHGQGLSVTGGTVYRGCAIDGLQGEYFFTDWWTGTIWSFRYNGVSMTDFQTFAAGSLNPPGQSIGRIAAIGEDAYGELYFADHGTATNNGEIFRLIANFPLAAENDCNQNNTHDDCELLDGSATDDNKNGVLDSCEPCLTLADCADTDSNGIRDDACLWYECAAGTCVTEPRVKQGDLAGEFGDCALDNVCDSHDQYHALNCFSDQDTGGAPDYPCEEGNPLVALNVDASGAFGSCVLDGACDGSDAFSALNCFSNQGPEGGPYECVCSGPQPGGPPGQQPPAVARTGISLRAPRTAAPGDLVDVHVHFDDALPDVRGYQLHLDSSGGKGGALQLVDIAVQPDRLGHVFAGLPYFSAFNVRTGQMTAGLETLGVPTPANGYLATFTYRVPLDAAGTFAIELQYDDHQAVPQGRTFLFASPLRKIGVTQASAARLTITAPRERRAQG